MIYVAIALTALAASFVSFFSGVGLGTILMPVFALFFDLPTAIALTAVVHLLNNIFKLGLVHQNIRYSLLLKFGIPALLASFAGAWLLRYVSKTGLIIYAYHIGEKEFAITWQGLIIRAIVFGFAVINFSQRLNR